MPARELHPVAYLVVYAGTTPQCDSQGRSPETDESSQWGQGHATAGPRLQIWSSFCLLVLIYFSLFYFIIKQYTPVCGGWQEVKRSTLGLVHRYCNAAIIINFIINYYFETGSLSGLELSKEVGWLVSTRDLSAFSELGYQGHSSMPRSFPVCSEGGNQVLTHARQQLTD